MRLEFAIALECDPTGCRVQYLDCEETGVAEYAAPVRDRIRIRRDQLVAVDRSTQPPQIVWRLFHGKVHAVDGDTVTVSRLDGDLEHVGDGGLLLRRVTPAPDLEAPVSVGDVVFYEHGRDAEDGELHDLAAGGRPAHPARVGARLFPKIITTYAELEA